MSLAEERISITLFVRSFTSKNRQIGTYPRGITILEKLLSKEEEGV
jgi:hypothetical protein